MYGRPPPPPERGGYYDRPPPPPRDSYGGGNPYQDSYVSRPPPPPPRWDDRRNSYGYGAPPPPPMDDRRGPPPVDFGPGYRRSRSPDFGGADRRGKRRRSLSPRRDGGRDFFPPRPSYRDERDRDDYFRDERRPGFDDGPGSGPRKPYLEPPEALDYLVTKRYLADFLRQSNPSFPHESQEAVDEAYRKYQNTYNRKSFVPFFDEMKEAIWFKERYDPAPDFEEQRKKRKEKGREGKLDAFLEELESGKFEHLSFDGPAYVKKKKGEGENGSPVKAGGDVEMKSVDDTESKPAAAEGANGDSLKKGEGSPDESNGVNVKLKAAENQLLIKTIPPDISRKDLEAHCSRVAGFEYLALSEPNLLKKYYRVGWIQFSPDADMEEAKRVLSESVIGTFTLHIIANEKAETAKAKFATGLLNTAERISKDLENVRLAALGYEKETSDPRGTEAIEGLYETGKTAAADDVEALAALNKKTLDLYLQYLRSVYHTCFYCVETRDFDIELERRCPGHFRRPEDNKLTVARKITEQGWVTKLDEKLPLLISRDTVNPADFGGDNLDEATHRICLPEIKQEEEGKFRCKKCSKLFSALKFIEKHIASKHPEVLGDSLENVKYFNNYILDPSHPLAPHEREQDVTGPVATNGSGASRPPPVVMGTANDYGGPGGRALSERMGGFDDSRRAPRRDGPPPPPPPGAALDPRARRGASSYADLDGTPAGVADVVLQY
ncbi:hypothetical protein T439DRAFT_330469 [Meredithblackwellia eburnea MCA 4105]